MPEAGRGVLARQVEWARCHCQQNEHEEHVKRRSRRSGRARSKKVELSNDDVETKNNDDDDNEEVLVVFHSRMPCMRARPFL